MRRVKANQTVQFRFAWRACVCVYSGLTSLSTICQCLVAAGSSNLTFIVLPH